MCFSLLRMYPNLIHFLVLNSIQINHIHEAFLDPIPIKNQGKCFPCLEITKHIVTNIVYHNYYTLSCRMSSQYLNSQTTKYNSKLSMNVYQRDRQMDDYIYKRLSHNMICVNLPNPLTVSINTQKRKS